MLDIQIAPARSRRPPCPAYALPPPRSTAPWIADSPAWVSEGLPAADVAAPHAAPRRRSHIQHRSHRNLLHQPSLSSSGGRGSAHAPSARRTCSRRAATNLSSRYLADTSGILCCQTAPLSCSSRNRHSTLIRCIRLLAMLLRGDCRPRYLRSCSTISPLRRSWPEGSRGAAPL